MRRLATLLLIAGCTRNFELPSQAQPGSLGASCSNNGQCAGGHCVDGVCCDTACAATCSFCAIPGSRGTCGSVPDNQDPRRSCGAPCTSCFHGLCAPAIAGSDPTLSCTGGAVCGTNQICGQPEGGACAADADCALGTCIAGGCRSTFAEEVSGNPLITPTSTTSRRPVSIAGSYRGDITALVDESTSDGNGGYFEADLYAMTRDVTGLWTGVDLMTDRLGEGGMAAAVEYLGTTAFVALYNHESAANGCPAGAACGIYGVLIAPHSPPSSPEIISDTATDVFAIRLAVDSKGALYLAYLDSTDQVIHVLLRTVGTGGTISDGLRS